jgi:hypothetical protein
MHSIGISVHTGWGACVVVSGSRREPWIIGNKVIRILDDDERFCFHRAAELSPELVQGWLARLHEKALARARSELSVLTHDVRGGAIVAKEGLKPELDSRSPSPHPLRRRSLLPRRVP